MAAVRYIVNDVDEAARFYRDMLGFSVEMHTSGKFAKLSSEDLTLFLNVPGAGSAGKAGGNPEPGGWNRFQVVTDDLVELIDSLRKKGATFRGQIAEAAAGQQILLEDPSGNVIELFEYAEKKSG
jgi:catechol 2,3-dioxygenase-like lactoylglutathione lyase family enzyme